MKQIFYGLIIGLLIGSAITYVVTYVSSADNKDSLENYEYQLDDIPNIPEEDLQGLNGIPTDASSYDTIWYETDTIRTINKDVVPGFDSYLVAIGIITEFPHGGAGHTTSKVKNLARDFAYKYYKDETAIINGQSYTIMDQVRFKTPYLIPGYKYSGISAIGWVPTDSDTVRWKFLYRKYIQVVYAFNRGSVGYAMYFVGKMEQIR